MNFNKISLIFILIISLISSIFASDFTNESNNDSIESFIIQDNFSVDKQMDLNPYAYDTNKDLKINKKIVDFSSSDLKTKEKLQESDNYFIVQFNSNPNKKEIQQLKDEGFNIIEYIGSNSYYVKNTNKLLYKIEETENGIKINSDKINDEWIIKHIKHSLKNYKETEILESKIIHLNKQEKMLISIQFYKDVDIKIAKKELLKSKYKIMNMIPKTNTILIYADNDEINSLSELEFIKKIDYFDYNLEDNLLYSKPLQNIDNVQSVYGLSGNNIAILEYEWGGVSGEHNDFGNRLIVKDLEYKISDHATHVAGILIGNGSINSNYKGIVYNSELYSHEIDNLLIGGEELDFELDYSDSISSGAKVASNSWGTGINSSTCNIAGTYNTWSELIDEYTLDGTFIEGIPIVFSMGNYQNANCVSGGYKTLSPQASAKNVISVGAINIYDKSITSYSSLGPTDAGRIKPDLVASGSYSSIMGIYSTISDDFIDVFNNSNPYDETPDTIDDYNSSYV